MLDHSCDCLFQKVEVLHAGNVLEVIDNYHQLSHLLLDSQVDPSLRNTSYNITKGYNQTYGDIKGTTYTTATTAYFTTTLLSGIVGSLARNYIPVNELQGSIQIRITLVGVAQTTWNPIPNPNTNVAVTVSNLEFHANMILLSPDVMSMIRAPEYTIYSESYTNFQQSYSAAYPQLQLLIPTRYSSLKALFVIFRKASAVANAIRLLYTSARSTMGFSDYQFLLGSEAYPPTKIKGTDSGFCEPFEELKKSFHCGGSTLGASMGIPNYTNCQLTGAGATGADQHILEHSF